MLIPTKEDLRRVGEKMLETMRQQIGVFGNCGCGCRPGSGSSACNCNGKCKKN